MRVLPVGGGAEQSLHGMLAVNRQLGGAGEVEIGKAEVHRQMGATSL